MSQQLKLSFPSPSKIKRINSVLSRKEKFFFYLAIIVLLASIVAWAVYFYLSYTKSVADFGGEYIEGVVGRPIFINPVLASSQTDLALSRLIFSSLLTYDDKGSLTTDLAKDYQIEDDGKRYRVNLKENIFWHDQKSELTADDIAFTVRIIQDSTFNKNPALKNEWKDVQVNVDGKHSITFDLPEPFAPFPNRLTFGILPRHIFKDVSPENFLTTPFNLEPVGSGPFIYSDMERDAEGNPISYRLIANPNYYNKRPYLEKITFNFYDSADSLYSAYDKKQISGFFTASGAKADNWNNRRDTNVKIVRLPLYFSILFNQEKSPVLAKKEVREALVLATDRESLVNEIFNGYASVESSPILKNFGDFSAQKSTEFDLKAAEKKLEENGWKKNAEGVREKDGQKLEFSFATPNFEDLTRTAETLVAQWKELGVNVTFTTAELGDLRKNFIQPREYQAILINHEYVGNDPDPLLFFHSKWKNDPGNNVALYDNRTVDDLLTAASKKQSLEERRKDYAQFEEIILNDVPGVFLYSPFSIYIQNQRVKGMDTEAIINASFRFTNVTDWYLKTTRVKKD
ncbi:MAG TPA: peptide ABC transporter substrate-binding protein [Candidatus Moranbacteria bacterium]|nr:peptide ABC transporter substrate-binding protein [Candidatus Moranbacteria bacterium]